jgi:hypothetical protein
MNEPNELKTSEPTPPATPAQSQPQEAVEVIDDLNANQPRDKLPPKVLIVVGALATASLMMLLALLYALSKL